MSSLKGKFVRREGTMVVFGSQKRPEWRPIEVTGHFDSSQLIPGRYYTLYLQDNRLFNAEILPERSGGGPEGPTSAQGASSREVPANGLMASATGLLKSLIESGMKYEEAEGLALRWAGLWGPAPFVDSPRHPAPPVAVSRAEARRHEEQGRWTSPNHYTNAPEPQDGPPPRDPDEPPF